MTLEDETGFVNVVIWETAASTLFSFGQDGEFSRHHRCAFPG